MSNGKLMNAVLGCEMKYDTFQNTFSPLYSSFGLQFDGNFAGIKGLFLHYNRSTRAIWNTFMTLPGEVKAYTPRADRVSFKTENAECEISFCQKDCFAVFCKTDESISFFNEKSEKTGELWISEKDNGYLIIQGYSENGDARDPDSLAPIGVGLRIIKGGLTVDGTAVSVSPDKNGEIYVCVYACVLNVSAQEIRGVLENAPENIGEAAKITRDWIADCIRDLNFEIAHTDEFTVLMRAVITLIFNLAQAPGKLAGYISSFPNRGQYPTHFMWDSCFQNLAYEGMNIKLAEDSILQLLGNIRADGKIPQFICSTWARPHDAQPALAGWASKRLFEKTGDLNFVKKVFEPLERNCRWWLSARMTRFGIISCADGLETGQDNSPRFDNGAVLAVDMNSYLLNQLKVTAEFAGLLGEKEKACYWENEAEKLNDGMIKYLYDEDANFFFDASAESGERQTLLTSSGFMPLWAGVSVPENKAKEMIRNRLLNPEYFYSDVPFPSVAYTEKAYDHADWWRGPTWMPEAWLMLEVLGNYGFDKEQTESAKRLYDILVRDGELHELFDSETGEGMGALEQGWTAAIFIKLFTMLNETGDVYG